MNERILGFAARAGLYHQLPNGNLYPTAMSAEESSIAYEKFAELIVRECALTLESITVPVFESCEDFDNGYNKALLTGSSVIKKYFGVKE